MSHHPRLSARRRALLFSLCLLTAIPPTVAQDTPTAAFSETVEVELVNVEVWVYEDGRPATGLGREQFRLLHDGAPMRITHFSEHRDGKPVGDQTRKTQGVDAVAPTAEPFRAQSHLIILFDTARLTPASQKRLSRDLRALVTDGRIPAQQIMILRLDGGLLVEAPFGSNARTLIEVFERLEKRRTSTVGIGSEAKQVVQAMQSVWTDLTGGAQSSSLRSVVNQVTSPTANQGASGAGRAGGGIATGASAGATGQACDDFVDRVEPAVARWAEREASSTNASLARLGDVTSFLSGLEGPKALLYVSDGLGMAPGTSATGFVRGLCPAYQTDLEIDALPQDMSPRFSQLIRRAGANRITFYAIQGSGIDRALGGTIGGASADSRGVRGFQRAYETSVRQALDLLTGETGGRALASGSDLKKELERLGEEMSSFYSLAYTPPPSEEPKDHRITVTLEGSSLEVRYRRAYSDKTIEQWLTERLESALYLGLVDNPLEARLGVESAIAKSEDLYTLPLHVVVPAARLTFSDWQELPISRLAVRVLALDTEKRSLTMTERTVTLPRPSEEAAESVDVRLEIDLAAGLHALAVAVRDQTSRETSFISTSIDITPPQPAS